MRDESVLEEQVNSDDRSATKFRDKVTLGQIHETAFCSTLFERLMPKIKIARELLCSHRCYNENNCPKLTVQIVFKNAAQRR